MKKQIILISTIMLLSILQIPLAFGAIYPSIEITFEDDPVTISPGTQGYITLNIRSAGSGTVEGIRVTATVSDYPAITYDGDWEKSLGDLYSGSSISTLFRFQVSSSTKAGLYEVKFKVTTTNAGSVIRYAIIKVEDSGVIDIVKVEPDVINIGEVTKMTFTIANNGPDTFYNILMTWEDTDNYILPSGSDNRLIISTIPPENTTDVVFDLVVNPALVPGVYPIFITLEYYDKTGTKQSVLSEVGLQVGGGTSFDIVLQDSSASSTTFAIANTGANTASSVIVGIPNQPSFSINGASSVSLGNLDAGDYTLATFQISSTLSNNSRESMNPPSGFDRSNFNPDDFDPSQFNFTGRPNFNNQNFTGLMGNNLLIDISYTDLYGNRQTVQEEVEMTVVSSGLSDGSSFSFSMNNGRSFGNMQSGDTGFWGSGTSYVMIGAIGMIILIAAIKFDKIKRLPEIIKTRKGNKK